MGSPPRTAGSPSTTPPPLPSTHDAACDQCRIKKIRCGRQQPRCSNCEQSKLDCTWTNKGKRPNQTKKLVDDFEKLGNRLGTLETKVGELASILTDLPTRISESQSNQGRHSSDTLRHTDVVLGGTPWQRAGSVVFQYASHVVEEPDGDQRYHGPSSLFSLLLDSDAAINNNLQPRASLREILLATDQTPSPPSWDAFFSYKEQVYRELSTAFAAPKLELEVFYDNLPPLYPPRPLLESLLDGYFRHINFVTPLVQRARVEEAIQKYYDPSTNETDIAWIIIFNYIVIRCLAGRHMPLEQPMTDTKILSADQFDQPFVVNIRRGLGFLDKLMKPRLANVQALGCLAIISPKYFPAHIAHMLLERTCSLAKSMGLHQQRATTTVVQTHERQYLFWLLFTLDKDLCLLLGTPPSLPHFDVDVPIPGRVSSDQLQRVQACVIEERIQILLYSASSAKMTDEQREDVVTELEADLDELKILQIEVDPEDPSSGWRGRPFLQLELKFIFHQLRVMVLRCSKNPEKKRICLLEARQSITHLARIRVAKTTIGGSMVLRRPFQWHSFSPFFELLASLFVYPPPESQQSDYDLLKSCVAMLNEGSDTEPPFTYCALLLKISSSCLDIADTFMKQSKAHMNATPSAPARTPPSNARSKRKIHDVGVDMEAQYASLRPHPHQGMPIYENHGWTQTNIPVRDDAGHSGQPGHGGHTGHSGHQGHQGHQGHAGHTTHTSRASHPGHPAHALHAGHAGPSVLRPYPVDNTSGGHPAANHAAYSRPDQQHDDSRPLDPFLGYTNADLNEMVRLSDDMMWGGEDIFAAMQRPMS